MAKRFKVTPKRVISTNGTVVLTPEMSIEVKTKQHTCDPFYNGAKEIIKTYKNSYNFDYQKSGCSNNDFEFTILPKIKVFSKESAPFWLGAILVIIIVCFILLYFSEAQIPTVFTSSGIVAIISAFIGVVLTVFVTSILLQEQAETQKKLLERQSEKESLKDKEIKIYEQKIRVYSEFIKQMWKLIKDEDEISYEELKKLRTSCFQELVLYLNSEQINKISNEIKEITPESNKNYIIKPIGNITNILQNNLDPRVDVKPGDFSKLYNSFKTTDLEEQTQSHIMDTDHQRQEVSISEKQSVKNITFWHFNMYGEQQIEAFKKGNWLLNLFEYGEEWRTNKLYEVKDDDVVFLFRRGGYGYIGAFKVVGRKVLKAEEYSNKQYSPEDIQKYDIYNAMQDGATYSSNIIVEPIAYNFKGVGCKTVRRRTIEKFITDPVAVNYILDRFGDTPTYYPLNEEQKSGIGHLDENTPFNISPANNDFFIRLIDIDYISKHRKELLNK